MVEGSRDIVDEGAWGDCIALAFVLAMKVMNMNQCW